MGILHASCRAAHCSVEGSHGKKEARDAARKRGFHLFLGKVMHAGIEFDFAVVRERKNPSRVGKNAQNVHGLKRRGIAAPDAKRLNGSSRLRMLAAPEAHFAHDSIRIAAALELAVVVLPAAAPFAARFAEGHMDFRNRLSAARTIKKILNLFVGRSPRQYFSRNDFGRRALSGIRKCRSAGIGRRRCAPVKGRVIGRGAGERMRDDFRHGGSGKNLNRK